MGLKFLRFHAKLKWNDKDDKKKKWKREKKSSEVVCLRYSYNPNGFDAASSLNDTIGPQPSTSGHHQPPPPARAPSIGHPPPIVARTLPPIYNRVQSEETEYIEVFAEYKKHTESEFNTNETPQEKEHFDDDGDGDEEEQKPIINQQFNKLSMYDYVTPNESDNSTEIVENGNRIYEEVDGKASLDTTYEPQQPYRIQLQDFEAAEFSDNDSSTEEAYDDDDEEEIISATNAYSSQAASIFFGSSDERPAPTPRKVNFYGKDRTSESSYGSEASA